VLLIAWGSCSAATAFVTGSRSLYLARLALGIAEAGFFPAVICYLGHWFPRQWRARATAMFLLAIPVANVIGAPISGLLVEHGGFGAFPGWRTMFLVEGLPAVLLGPLMWRLLPDGPHEARWLGDAERDWLVRRLAPGEAPSAGVAAVLLGIGIGLACALAAIPAFWSLAATLLTGGSGLHDAASVAAINTIASLASFTGPYLTGRLKDATGGYTAGLGLVAASLAIAGLSASAMHLSARTRMAR
jgi:MFS family permease